MLSSRSYFILGHDRPFLFYMTVYHFHDKLRSDYMCELIYLKTWLLCYKNCRVALFLTFFIFLDFILKLLTISFSTVKKNVLHIFFFKDLSIFIYPYTELLYSVSQNIRYHLLCIFMIYIVLKNDHGHPNHSVGSEIGHTVMYHEEIQMYVRWRF